MQEEMGFLSAEQIEEWERQKKEEAETNKRRRFNAWRAKTVHGYSCFFCTSTLAITLPYIYTVWRNELIGELLKDFVFCIVATSFVICWAICWWVQLAPKLLAAKKVDRAQKILYIGFSFPIIPVNAMTALNGASPMFFFFSMMFIFGGRVAIELGTIWAEYRTSSKYGHVSFFDYCNEVVSEQEK